jgi:hypothetical protein
MFTQSPAAKLRIRCERYFHDPVVGLLMKALLSANQEGRLATWEHRTIEI